MSRLAARDRRRDGVSVIEIGGHVAHAWIETLLASAQACNIPPVGQQALRDVAAADAGSADDEGTAAHQHTAAFR
jgi:hypothetical protein